MSAAVASAWDTMHTGYAIAMREAKAMPILSTKALPGGSTCRRIDQYQLKTDGGGKYCCSLFSL